MLKYGNRYLSYAVFLRCFLPKKLSIMHPFNCLKNAIVVLLALTIFLLACNDADEPQPKETQAVFPLQVGNYWIYEFYRTSETGETLPTQNYDSVYISEKVNIGGTEYYSLEGWYGGSTDLIRDSMGYLVGSDGKIYYAPEEDRVFYTERIGLGSDDRYISVDYTMSSEQSVSVPAGEFTARATEGEYDYTESPNGCDKTSRTYYTPGIGRIKEEVFYLISCDEFNRHLVRYHLE